MNREELRRQIDAARREQAGVTADGIRHGTESAYGRDRCRCDECRRAASDARRRRFQAQPQETRWAAQYRYRKAREHAKHHEAQPRASVSAPT